VSAGVLLNRLPGVRQTGPGRWISRCPGHDDRSPSLSIRELDDGRVLVHCFTGCGAVKVLESLGLGWSALFPQPLPGHSYASTHSKIPPRDLLEVISEEVTVVALIAADFLAKKSISERDWQRLAQAAARIGKARDYAR
jgi:hypothetical protein